MVGWRWKKRQQRSLAQKMMKSFERQMKSYRVLQRERLSVSVCETRMNVSYT